MKLSGGGEPEWWWPGGRWDCQQTARSHGEFTGFCYSASPVTYPTVSAENGMFSKPDFMNLWHSLDVLRVCSWWLSVHICTVPLIQGVGWIFSHPFVPKLQFLHTWELRECCWISLKPLKLPSCFQAMALRGKAFFPLRSQLYCNVFSCHFGFWLRVPGGRPICFLWHLPQQPTNVEPLSGDN